MIDAKNSLRAERSVRVAAKQDGQPEQDSPSASAVTRYTAPLTPANAGTTLTAISAAA